MVIPAHSGRNTLLRPWVIAVGELLVVGGVVGWALGLPFGQPLVILGLVLVLIGMQPGKPRLQRALGSAHVMMGRRLKGEDAVGMGRTALRHYRKFAAKHPDQGLQTLAWTLDWHREQLSELGRFEEAEPIAREAVTTWREVVTADPSRRADLSRSLNHLTVTLGALKRYDELITLTEEAIVIQRSLIATQDVVLALHLQNLALERRRAEQWSAALPVSQEAAGLYRRLVATDPEQLENAADTARGLAETLRELYQRQEALEVTKEWVGYERALTARRPSRRPELAGALSLLGSRLVNLDEVDDGITHWHEALDVWRRLASESDEHRSDYAGACAQIGRNLGVIGRSDEALPVLREGLGLRRTLAAVDARQYDELLDDLAHAARDTRRQEFVDEAVVVVREHLGALTGGVVLHAVELLRDAGFTDEADRLERS
ncbi:tetratricopeptide repeat protein [Kribbella sp. WER1]